MHQLDLHVARNERADARSDSRDVRAHRVHDERRRTGHERLVNDRPHDKRRWGNAEAVSDGGGQVRQANVGKNSVVCAHCDLLSVLACIGE